jgi:DNA-binding winged helix-turn-helix (wHTH) protein/tetratricopeptide (TPR) repeat protein
LDPIIRFDRFELNLEQQSLQGLEGPISLRPQTFAVLCHLVEKAPAVVSQDELLDAVWGHQATSVSSVAQTIKELRHALGDSSSQPEFIATRRRMGYQFIAEIDVGATDGAATAPTAPMGPSTSVDPAPAALPSWLSRPAALLVVAVLFIGLAAFWRLQPSPPQPAERLPVLAIGDMVNTGDDPDLNWLSPALETYLGHALVELGGFRVLAIDQPVDEDATEADFLIDGRYLSAGVDGARLLAQLRRPGSDELVTSLESNDADWDVARLSINLATAIRDHLGFPAPPQADPSAITARLPSQAATQRKFFEANAAIEAMDFDRALAAVDQGLALQNDNPPLIMLKAEALSALGRIEDARSLSEQALSATRLWPRRDRLALEASAAILDFEFERAADRLQALTQFYPEPASSRRLVHALIQAGRLNAARESLASLRLKQPEDARLALLGAELARVERQQDERLEQATAARRLAEADGTPSLIVAARQAEAQALIRTGQLDAAEATLDTLIDGSLPMSDSDRARARLGLNQIEFQRGNLDQALAMTDPIEASFAALSHPEGLADLHMLRASILDRKGQAEGAIEQMRLAQQHLETLNDPRRLAQAGVLFGVTLMRARRLDEAEASLAQAASYFRSVNDRQGEGAALINQATLLARNDRPSDAEPLFQRALEAFEDAGDLRGQAIVLSNLAAIAGQRRDKERAIELSEQALGMFELIGAQTDIARVSYNLALTHQRDGELLRAETRLRQAAAAFEAQGAASMQTRALTSLANLYVDMGRDGALAETLAEIDSIETNDAAELSVAELARGREALLAGATARARAAFEEALAMSVEAGSEPGQRRARLNLGRAALAEGESVAAERIATALVSEFAALRNTAGEIDALLLLADARIAQGRRDEASRDLSLADSRLSESPNARQSLELALLRSQVSEPDLGRQHLAWVVETANEMGFTPLARRAEQRRLDLDD